MPPTVITSVYQITVKAEADNQPILNVFHYRDDQGVPTASPGLAEDLLEIFQGRWQAAVIPVVHESYRVSSYILQEFTSTVPSGNPPPLPPSELVAGFQVLRGGDLIADQGALTGEPLPTYVAVGVRKFTPVPTRRFRGSFRIGPILEADSAFNALTPAGVGRYLPVQFEPLRRIVPPAPADNAWEMIVFSETTAGLADPTGDLRPFGAPVISFATNPFLTSQVSRKRRP